MELKLKIIINYSCLTASAGRDYCGLSDAGTI